MAMHCNLTSKFCMMLGKRYIRIPFTSRHSAYDFSKNETCIVNIGPFEGFLLPRM